MESLCDKRYYSHFSQAEDTKIRNQIFVNKWNYCSQPFCFVGKNAPEFTTMWKHCFATTISPLVRSDFRENTFSLIPCLILKLSPIQDLSFSTS